MTSVMLNGKTSKMKRANRSETAKFSMDASSLLRDISRNTIKEKPCSIILEKIYTNAIREENNPNLLTPRYLAAKVIIRKLRKRFIPLPKKIEKMFSTNREILPPKNC